MYPKSSAPVCSSLLVVAVLIVMLSACSATDEAFATADWIPDGVTSTSYGLNMPGSTEPYLRSGIGHAGKRRLGIFSWFSRTMLEAKIKAKFDGQKGLQDSEKREFYKNGVIYGLEKRLESGKLSQGQLLPILSRNGKRDVELAKTLAELNNPEGNAVLKVQLEMWTNDKVLIKKVKQLLEIGDLEMSGAAKEMFTGALLNYADLLHSHKKSSDGALELFQKI